METQIGKASENNDVNGGGSNADTTSGRGIEVSQVVIKRNPPKDSGNLINQPAMDVLQGNDRATTKAGLPRQRLNWSDEMNTHVMRCYYTASKLETIKSGFRSHMLKMFLEKYPHLNNVTEQRLMDQKRSITTHKRITERSLQLIKEQVCNTLKPESTTRRYTARNRSR
ncbi:hypothetical protein PPYR_00205 [Photinus pyralis]|uniref:Uncharacterized protein n=1 Tax=Photinus pyralis TaxID=7054 RepID=A0A5N4B0W9_PHOPY|nr:hypothetical protein PPYR_00205 [Photinus pyralis]